MKLVTYCKLGKDEEKVKVRSIMQATVYTGGLCVTVHVCKHFSQSYVCVIIGILYSSLLSIECLQ